MAKHLTLLLAVVVTARLAVGALLALRRRRDPTDRPAGALDAVLALDRTGPSDPVVDLARHATLLLAEASHAERDPADMAGLLSSARDVGAAAAQAGVTRLPPVGLLVRRRDRPSGSGARSRPAAPAWRRGRGCP